MGRREYIYTLTFHHLPTIVTISHHLSHKFYHLLILLFFISLRLPFPKFNEDRIFSKKSTRHLFLPPSFSSSVYFPSCFLSLQLPVYALKYGTTREGAVPMESQSSCRGEKKFIRREKQLRGEKGSNTVTVEKLQQREIKGIFGLHFQITIFSF